MVYWKRSAGLTRMPLQASKPDSIGMRGSWLPPRKRARAVWVDSIYGGVVQGKTKG